MSPAVKGAAALVKGQCGTCHGRRQLVVRVNRGRRAEVECPTCSGTGKVDCCAACGNRDPGLHVCEMACNLPSGDVVCGAPTLGSVVTRDRYWARCEDHGGIEAAENARRREDPRWLPDRLPNLGEVFDGMEPLPGTSPEAPLHCHEPHQGGDFAPTAPPAPPSPTGANAVTTSAELDATARDLFERAAPPAASPGPAAPPTPPITSNKRRRRKPPTSAPAIARRRRQPTAPELPGIPDHHDVPFCGCDRCWERDA